VIGLAVQARESYAQYYPYLPPRAYPPSAGHLGATGPTEADAGGSGSAQGDTRYMALPPEDRPETGPKKELPPQLRRTEVDYYTRESAGTIIVDTPNTYLYLVLGDGRALRYGIGVGREGFTWTGVENISRMGGMARLEPARADDRASALFAALHGRGRRQPTRRARSLSR